MPLLSSEGWGWGGMHLKDRIRIEDPNTRDGGAIFQERSQDSERQKRVLTYS